MKYKIIAIEREYGSGGSEIGKQVAAKLQCPCYGKEILNMVAEKYNVSAKQMEAYEEASTGSLLHSLFVISQMGSGSAEGLSERDRLNLAEEKIIKELAHQGPCVMIGRCAANVLKDRDDVLKVFIHASKESRCERAIEEYDIDRSNIQVTIEKIDRQRSNYYKSNTGLNWHDIRGYHIVLDSSTLDIKGCVEAICAAAED